MRGRLRPARAMVVGAGVVLTLLAGACSKGGTGPSADDAATKLRQALQTDDGQTACMRDRFGDADVAAVMDPEHQPSAEQRAAFVRAIRGCLPIDTFAAVLSTALPTDLQTTSREQQACVRATILDLSPADQDVLYVYFANPAALAPDAVLPASTRLTESCGLGAPDRSAGTVVGPVPPTTG